MDKKSNLIPNLIPLKSQDLTWKDSVRNLFESYILGWEDPLFQEKRSMKKTLGVLSSSPYLVVKDLELYLTPAFGRDLAQLQEYLQPLIYVFAQKEHSDTDSLEKDFLFFLVEQTHEGQQNHFLDLLRGNKTISEVFQVYGKNYTHIFLEQIYESYLLSLDKDQWDWVHSYFYWWKQMQSFLHFPYENILKAFPFYEARENTEEQGAFVHVDSLEPYFKNLLHLLYESDFLDSASHFMKVYHLYKKRVLLDDSICIPIQNQIQRLQKYLCIEEVHQYLYQSPLDVFSYLQEEESLSTKKIFESYLLYEKEKQKKYFSIRRSQSSLDAFLTQFLDYASISSIYSYRKSMNKYVPTYKTLFLSTFHAIILHTFYQKLWKVEIPSAHFLIEHAKFEKQEDRLFLKKTFREISTLLQYNEKGIQAFHRFLRKKKMLDSHSFFSLEKTFENIAHHLLYKIEKYKSFWGQLSSRGKADLKSGRLLQVDKMKLSKHVEQWDLFLWKIEGLEKYLSFLKENSHL